jgi:branched-subunit amino acid transport protein
VIGLEWFWIIAGMAFVTYIPRMLPAILLGQRNVSPWIGRWLKSIPYAALGALIFPGILTVEKGEPLVGLAGGIVAAVLAFFRMNMLIVIVGAIGAVAAAKAMLG